MKFLITLLFLGSVANAQQIPTGPIQFVKDKKAVNVTIDSVNPLNNVFLPIQVSSLPLPTGAATETTLSALNTKIPSNLTVTSTRLLVDGSGVTQPVSASSLPLPTGAATEAKQDTANSSLASIDSKLTSPIAITGSISATNPSVGTTGATSPTSATLIGATDVSGDLKELLVDPSSNLYVNVNASQLPLGAATEATVFNIDSKISTVDTSNVSISASVLPTGAATESTLSAISTKLTDKTQATKITDGTVTSGIRALNDNVVGADYGIITNSVIHGLTTGGGGGYVDVKVNPSGALTVDATVSSSALPTGAATETTLSALNTKVPANLTVSSTRLLVDGSGVTQPVSAASLPLPTGAATESTLSSVDTKIPSNLTVSSTRLLVDGSGVTQPVSIAASVQTKSPVNTGGSFFSGSISTVTTVTAPANATEVIIQAEDTNTANMRFVIGGTASASSGIQLQPGRSEQLKAGSNISIIPESGTQKYNIQFIVQ